MRAGKLRLLSDMQQQHIRRNSGAGRVRAAAGAETFSALKCSTYKGLVELYTYTHHMHAI